MSSESVSPSKSAEINPARFRVVGIGASAGGLESLEQFFSSLPANPGMAFVVVQHLSPDFRSVMDELLASIHPSDSAGRGQHRSTTKPRLPFAAKEGDGYPRPPASAD